MATFEEMHLQADARLEGRIPDAAYQAIVSAREIMFSADRECTATNAISRSAGCTYIIHITAGANVDAINCARRECGRAYETHMAAQIRFRDSYAVYRQVRDVYANIA